MHVRISRPMLAATVAVFAASFVAAQSARAATLTDANGMTLYTFDKDGGGVSSCYAECAVRWPPYLAAAGQDRGAGWTRIERKDGAMQWAHDGKPLYLFANDKAAGEMKGDGVGGVWHVARQ